MLNSEDLLEYFTDLSISPEESVLTRTKDAKSLIDTRPRRAWRRAFQAMRLLGNPDLPNGVSNRNVRSEALRTLLSVAARLLVDGVPEGIQRREVVDASEEALRAMNSKSDERAFKRINEWTMNRKIPPFDLMNAQLALDQDGEWLGDALVSVAQALHESLRDFVTDTNSARLYVKNVEAWLKITQFIGDISTEARDLRCLAFDTLLQAGDLESAEKVWNYIKPEDYYRSGQLREAQGKPEDAAEAFEVAGATKEAMRNWRVAGIWEKAYPLAEGEEKECLEWLINMERIVDRVPEDLPSRLTDGEKDRLSDLLKSVTDK